jgi:hypothetical protein
MGDCHAGIRGSRGCESPRRPDCRLLSAVGIPVSPERGTRRDSTDGGPSQMMLDDAEEGQLKGPIVVLAPYRC